MNASQLGRGWHGYLPVKLPLLEIGNNSFELGLECENFFLIHSVKSWSIQELVSLLSNSGT